MIVLSMMITKKDLDPVAIMLVMRIDMANT